MKHKFTLLTLAGALVLTTTSAAGGERQELEAASDAGL